MLASLTVNGCVHKPRHAGGDGGGKQSEFRDSLGARITHSTLSDRQRANVLLPSSDFVVYDAYKLPLTLN